MLESAKQTSCPGKRENARKQPSERNWFFIAWLTLALICSEQRGNQEVLNLCKWQSQDELLIFEIYLSGFEVVSSFLCRKLLNLCKLDVWALLLSSCVKD